MGHVVNPLAFRLGKSSFWNFNYYHFKNKVLFFKYFFLNQQIFNFCKWVFRDNTFNYFLHRFHRYKKKKYFLLLENIFLLSFKKNKFFIFKYFLIFYKKYFLYNIKYFCRIFFIKFLFNKKNSNNFFSIYKNKNFIKINYTNKLSNLRFYLHNLNQFIVIPGLNNSNVPNLKMVLAHKLFLNLRFLLDSLKLKKNYKIFNKKKLNKRKKKKLKKGNKKKLKKGNKKKLKKAKKKKLKKGNKKKLKKGNKKKLKKGNKKKLKKAKYQISIHQKKIIKLRKYFKLRKKFFLFKLINKKKLVKLLFYNYFLFFFYLRFIKFNNIKKKKLKLKFYIFKNKKKKLNKYILFKKKFLLFKNLINKNFFCRKKFFIWRKYLNMKIRKSGSSFFKFYSLDNILNKNFSEKLNYFLIHFVCILNKNFLKIIKLRLKIAHYLSQSIKFFFYSRELLTSELSSIKSYLIQKHIKLNLVISHNPLFFTLEKKINLYKIKEFKKKIFRFKIFFFKFKILFNNILNLFWILFLFEIFFIINYLKIYFFYFLKLIKKQLLYKKNVFFNFLIFRQINFYLFLKYKYNYIFDIFTIKNMNKERIEKNLNTIIFDFEEFFLLKFLNNMKSTILSNFFNKIFKSFTFNFNFFILKPSLLNAQLIFKFIFRQLRKNKTIMRIINVLLFEVKRQKNFAGFKIMARGRFTRKERAFNKLWFFRKLAYSTIAIPLDYHAGLYKSKFGLCSIRVWIFHKL
jgi:hypothetical protein